MGFTGSAQEDKVVPILDELPSVELVDLRLFDRRLVVIMSFPAKFMTLI